MRPLSRVPYVPQMEATECGAACLAMVLAAWGHHVPLVAVREACKVSRDGANAANLLQAGRLYGLAAEAVTLEVEALGDLPLPAILHWEFMHFVVLERLVKDGAVLVDPSSGRQHVAWAGLARAFTGVALVFAPEAGFQPRARPRLSVERYLGMLKGFRPSLAQLLGASILLQVAGLVLPMANQVLVDRVLLPGHPPWLWGLALVLGLAFAAIVLLTLLRSFVLQGLQHSLDRRLTEGFVGHLISLPLAFFLQRQPGDLMQRVQSNAEIRDLCSTKSLAAVLDALLLMGYLILMMVYAPSLGALVVALGGLQVAAHLGLRRRNRQLMAAETALQGQESAARVEALTCLETLQAAGAQGFALGRWAPHLARRMNVNRARLRLKTGLDQAMALLQGLCSAAVFYVGGQAVMAERMTLGVFVAFLTLQALFLVPLASLLNACADFQLIGSHFLRLDDVLDTAPEASGTLAPARLQGAIQLEGVAFRYSESSPWLFRELDVTIRPGEKVAIVGRTGTGKSTLARLLLGMHPVTRGSLRFDGHELGTLDLTCLRQQMGVVLQEPFLFDDTVRANLTLGNQGIPMERLRWAADLAQIHRTIEGLPQGYQTRLGENASTLSGGERQRLCLARAIALEPAILLLDEATSSLDLETERLVHSGLAALGCTRVVIAHRLETVKDADRILVLAEGAIVAQGTFEELSSRQGLFQELVRAMEVSCG